MSIYCPLSMASDKPKVCIESKDSKYSSEAHCRLCPFENLEDINILFRRLNKELAAHVNRCVRQELRPASSNGGNSNGDA